MMYTVPRHYHIPFQRTLAPLLVSLVVFVVMLPMAVSAALAPSPSSDQTSASAAVSSPTTLTPRYSIELSKTAPQSRNIKVGGAVSFEAAVYADGKRLNDEDLVFHWSAAKDVRFVSPDGPSETTAIFMGWGERQIEVTCSHRIGRSLVDIGRSSPVVVNVVKPHVALRIMPEKPMVGEKVTAKFSIDSDLKTLQLMWRPLPDNARLVDVDTRTITFYMTDDTPLTVSVVPLYTNPGNVPTEPLEEASATLTASPYDVSIKNIGPVSEPPQVWKDGVGPIEVPRELAVNQKVKLRADVSPSPRSAHLRYVWTLEEDGQLDSDASAREKVVTKPSVGPLLAHVEVHDSRGILLGKGQESVSFTISQRDLDQVDININRTKNLVQEAKASWEKGELDNACLAAERAVQLYPAFEPALQIKETYLANRDVLVDHIDRARSLIEKNTFDQATPHLEAAAKISSTYPEIKQLYAQMSLRKSNLERVAVLLSDAQENEKTGQMDNALATVNDALILDPQNREALALRNVIVKKRQDAVDLMREASVLADNGKIDKAIALIEKGEKTFPHFSPMEEFGRELAERQQNSMILSKLVVEAKSAWDNGNIDDALTATSNALSLRPDWETASALQQSIIDKRETIIRIMDDATQLLNADAFDQAKTALAGARHINANYPPIAQLETRIDAARKQAEARTEKYLKSARELVDNNRFDAALAVLRDLNQDSFYTNTQKTQAEALFLAAQSGKSKQEQVQTAMVKRENSPLERACLTRFHRAYEKQKNKRFTTAIAEYTEIIEQCPTLCDAMNNIGVSYNQMGNVKEALPWYEKARACNPQNAIYSNNAQEAKNWLVATNSSSTQQDEKKVLSENECSNLFSQARTLQTKGEHTGAIDVFKNILESCPTTCKAINDVGVSLYALGHVKESLRWFEHASRCDPRNKLFKDNSQLTKQQIQETDQKRSQEHRYVKAGL